MAMVKDWIDRWKARHLSVVPRADWPDTYSEFWGPWFRGLIDAKAEEPDANEASDRMALEAPPHLNQQAGAFLALVRSAQAERASAGSLDMDAAKAASRGCRWCDGYGIASVVRRDGQPFQARTAGGLEVELGSIAVACECPHGRWHLTKQRASKDGNGNPGRVMIDLVAIRPHVEPVLDADPIADTFAADPNSMTAMIRRFLRANADRDVESPEMRAALWQQIKAKRKADADADRRGERVARVADHVAEKLRDEAAALADALKSAHAGPVDDPDAIEAARAKADATRRRHEQAKAARQAEPEPVEAWDDSEAPF
jgi:hypothetical protein